MNGYSGSPVYAPAREVNRNKRSYAFDLRFRDEPTGENDRYRSVERRAARSIACGRGAARPGGFSSSPPGRAGSPGSARRQSWIFRNRSLNRAYITPNNNNKGEPNQ